jgi:hypothetical protein
MKEFYLKQPVMAAIAILYCVAVLVMGIRAGEPSQIWWWIKAIPFLGWVASPVVVGLWLSRLMKSLAARLLFLAALIGIGIYGFADQWHVMFVGPSDAQNALIMIFDPLLQWMAVGLIFFIVLLGDRLVLKS